MMPTEARLGLRVRFLAGGRTVHAVVIQCRYRVGVAGAHALTMRGDDGSIYQRAPQEVTLAGEPGAGRVVWSAERGWHDQG